MKTGRYFAVRILLTVLLTFSMIGFFTCAAITGTAKDADACITIIQEEQLAEKVYTALEKDFKEAYNTTAIPPEIYTDAITTQWLEAEMCAYAEAYFDYINGTKSMEYKIDFTALEESITTFFYEYAQSIDYEPDEVFEEKLGETITNAEKKVSERMDAFYLNTLYENGILTKVQTYLPYVNLLNIGLGLMSLILIAILVILEHNGSWRKLYWAGSGIFCAGVLLTIPLAYIVGTNAVAGFSIKNPIVYTAITELLSEILHAAMVRSILLVAAGLILIAVSVILNKNAEKTE